MLPSLVRIPISIESAISWKKPRRPGLGRGRQASNRLAVMAITAPPQAPIRIPPTQLLIGGAWVDAASGQTFETRNPATEELIADVAQAGPEDAARAALEGPWGTMRASDRSRLLFKFAELLREQSEAIISLESLDGGKPISSVRRQDYPAMVDCLE